MDIPQNIVDLKTRLVQQNIKGLALDIDETLSWTVGYWMDELSKRFGNPENLTPESLVEKYRYTQNVPHWQTEEAIAWMNAAIMLDSIQEELPLIEGAKDTVQQINELISIQAYLTARPEEVISGTQRWLDKHDFPKAQVIARPNHTAREEGNKWKAQLLDFLFPQIIGIVDDNFGLIEYLPEKYQGTILLFDNKDHPKKGEFIIPCPTWNDVLENVKRLAITKGTQ